MSSAEISLFPLGGGGELPPFLGEDRSLERCPGRTAVYETIVMSEEEDGVPLNPRAVMRAFCDPAVDRQVKLHTFRLYGGGGMQVVVDFLYVAEYDTFKRDDCEYRVIQVRGRYSLSDRTPVAEVQAIKVADGTQTSCFIVACGLTVKNFALAKPGCLVAREGCTTLAISPIRSRRIDPTRPLRGSGLFSGCTYRISDALWRARKVLCCRGDYSAVLRVDDEVVKHLYNERLNTLKSLGESKAQLIIQSSAQKFTKSTIHDTTVKTTCAYFAEKYLQQDAVFNDTGGSLFDKKSEAPRLFEKDVCVYLTGGGQMESELDPTRVTVVDNGLLRLKNGVGVTFEGGVLTFSTEFEKPRAVYHYGPAVASAASKYSTKSTANASNALKRMTNSRSNEKVLRVKSDLTLYYLMLNHSGKSKKERNRMTTVFVEYSKKFGAFDKWGMHRKDFYKLFGALETDAKKRKEKLASVLGDYVGQLAHAVSPEEKAYCNAVNRELQMVQVAHEEHAKKEERVATVEEMLAEPRLFDRDLWPSFVEGKVKWENGKFLKLARQYVSLGCNNTLEWLKLPETLKHAMARVFYVESINTEFEFFPSPSPENIDSWAERVGQALDPEDTRTIVSFHSDDSFFSMVVNIQGVKVRIFVCIDIKKCDLSHSPGLFVYMAGIFETMGFDGERIMALFMQLKKDIRIIHPDRGVNEFAIFESLCIMLFSGSTLTTLVNNFASLLILINVVIGLGEPEFASVGEVKTSVISFAAEVGYDVSLDAFEVASTTGLNLANITFLKHFPACTTSGKWVAQKELATLIRGAGISDDECLARPRIREIVNGWNTAHRNPLLDHIFSVLELTWPENPSCEVLTMDAYTTRYGVSAQTLLAGFDLFYSLDKPCFVTHPGLDAVLRVGYELPRLFEGEPRQSDFSS